MRNGQIAFRKRLSVTLALLLLLTSAGLPGAGTKAASADESPAFSAAANPPLVVEGENAASHNYPTSGILNDPAYSGGALLRLETPDQAPSGGYVAEYEVVAAYGGEYELTVASTPPVMEWSSPYAISINEGAFNDVANARQIGDVNNTVRLFSLGNVQLQEGVNTLVFRVNQRRQIDNNYVLYLDAIALHRILPPQFAEVTEYPTALAAAPTLMTELRTANDVSVLEQEGALPQVMMLNVNDGLEVFRADEHGMELETIGDLDSVLPLLDDRIIPAFRVEDASTASVLAAYAEEEGIEDAYVISSQGNLVKQARQIYPMLRGIVKFDTAGELSEAQLLEIRRTVNRSRALIALLPYEAVSRDQVSYLQKRLITVWAENSEETASAHHLIGAGVDGIWTASPQQVVSAFEVYSGQAALARTPLLIGHRGVPALAPENTIEGSQLAYSMGADIVEIDIRQSKDGHIVVIHDDLLDRTTTGTGKVEDYTLAELKQNKANKQFPDSYPDVEIPTLAEYFDAFKNTDLIHFIEIKTYTTDIIDPLIDLIQTAGVEDQVAILSFGAEHLRRTSELMPEMSVGLLTPAIANDADIYGTMKTVLQTVLDLNATFHTDYAQLGSGFIKEAKHRGLGINAWVYRNLNDFTNAITLGVHGLTLDNVGWASNWAGTISAEQPNYTIAQGETLTLHAVAEQYDAQSFVFDPDIIVLSGSELIEATGNTIRALDAASGTVQVLLKYTQEMQPGQAYELYTAPVEIAVQPAHTPIDLLVEGEEALSDNFTNSGKILNDPAYSSGALLRLETPDQAPSGGYVAEYEVVAPQSGAYELTIASTPPEEMWTSPYAIAINGGGYEPVVGARQTADVNGTVRKYLVKTVQLQEGLNTFSIRVDTRRSLDQQYVVYLDAFKFTLLPFGLQSLDAGGPFRVFEAEETVTLDAKFAGQSPTADELNVEVKDYWDNTILTQTIPIAALATEAELNLGMLPYGHYTVKATLDSIGDQAITYVAIVPDYDEREMYNDTPFALDGGFSLHVNRSKIGGFAEALKLSGVKWVRDRFHWSTVNPAPGIFDYSHFQPLLQEVAEKGISILSTYQDSPAWTKTTEGSIPDDLLAAYRFAADSGAELGDWITAWEAGNEPDGHFTGMDETADQYAAFLKAAAIGYKDSGAASRVSISGFAERPNDYIRLVMDNEVLPYLDIYSFHGYPLPYGSYDEAIVPFPPNAANHLDFIKTYAGSEEIDKWMTEAGLAIHTGEIRDLTATEQQAQARYMITSAVKSLAAGVDKHFWFFMPHYLENGNEYGMFNQLDSPYAAYVAIAWFTHALGEGSYIGEWGNLPSEVEGYRFADSGRQVGVFWSEQPQSVTVAVNADEVEVIDLMGGSESVPVANGQLMLTIGQDPIYVKYAAPAASALDGDARVEGGETSDAEEAERTTVLSAAQRVVLAQSYSSAARSSAKVLGAYQLDKDQPNTVEVEIYNFNSETITGTIEGTATGGWQMDSASKAVTVAPYAKETVTFTLTSAPAVANAVKNKVRFQGLFDNEYGTASLAYVMTGLEAVEVESIAEAGVPESWDFTPSDAKPPTASIDVRAGSEPGTVRFKYDFTATNQWIYPYLELPEVLDLSAASGLAFVIHAEEDIADTDVKLILVEEGGGKYYTFNGFEIKAGWNRYVIPFGMLSVATFGPPDPNSRLDLEQVSHIQIGINTNLLNVPAFTLVQAGTFVIPQIPVPATGIQVEPDTAILQIGSQLLLSADVLPTQATNGNVAWSSSNSAVATVDSSGLVTAMAAGAASITATAEDGGWTDEALITVHASTSDGEGGSVGNNGSETGQQGNTSNGEMDGGEKHTVRITAEELRELANAADPSAPVVYATDSEVYEVALPAAAREMAGNKTLRIVFGHAALELPAGFLDTLERPVGWTAEQALQAEIVLRAAPALSDARSSKWLQEAAAVEMADLAWRSDAVELELSWQPTEESAGRGGQEAVPIAWPRPIAIWLPLQADADVAIADGSTHVYRMQGAGQLQYYGGSAANDEIASAPMWRFNAAAAGTYGVLTYRKMVRDVEAGHWAHSAIQSLAARQALSFAEDGSYAPAAPMTRIGILELLVKALGIQPTTELNMPFSDVAVENDETAVAAFQAGLVLGTGAGKLEPRKTVTREQLAVLLIRAVNQYYERSGQTVQPEAGEAVLQRFDDAPDISGWAREETVQAVEAGLLIGKGAGRFSPQAPVTHAEAAVAVQRLLQWIER